MLKGYVIGWRDRPAETAYPSYTQTDVYFDHRSGKGYSRETRDQAEFDCRYLDSLDIRVTSAEGGAHLCTGFKAEERAPREFVVFCPYPLVPTRSGWALHDAGGPSADE